MENDEAPEPDRGGKARGDYHHGDLRAALLAAALAQVERGGADSVNLSGLAQALGVSQPAPYRHFPDRAALLAAVALEGFARHQATLKAAATQASRFSAPARIAQAHVAFGLGHLGLYRLMFATPVSARDDLLSASHAGFDLLLAALQEVGYGQGARRRAVKLWAAAHGLVMFSDQGLFDQELTTMPLAALIDDIVA